MALRQNAQQLISQANDGDLEALWRLQREMQPTNITVEIADAILKHLKLDLVPNLDEDEHKVEPFNTYADRALPCITMLSTVAKALQSQPRARTAISERIQENLDGICMWINFLLTFGLSIDMETTPGKDFRKPYFYHAQLLCDLMDCDGDILRALLSGTRFFDLILRIWMTEGKEGELFMNITSPNPCPIITLMMKTLQQDVGREMLLQRIRVRPPTFQYHFVDRIKMRAIQIIEVEVPTARQVGYIDTLLSISEILLADKEPLDLRRSFVKQAYLTEFCTVLNAISMEAGMRPDRHTVMPAMLRPTHKLFSLVMTENARAARNYAELLEGDMLTHLVRVLVWLPDHDRSAADVGKILLQLMGMYTIYPVFIKQLMSTKLPEQLAAKLYKNPHIAPVWDDFRAALRDRMEAYTTMTDGSGHLCDNFSPNTAQCDHTARMRRPPNDKGKQCSGCSYVVYCSEECQKQDWQERHRDECKRARLDHRRRRSNGVWYSHMSRAFHSHFVATMYNIHYPQMQRECAEYYPTIPFHQIIPVLQSTSIRFGINLEPVVPIPRSNPHYEKKDIKTAWWERGDKTQFKQHWLKPRVSQVIEGYRDGKIGKTDVRVAEGAFPLGNDFVVFLTVKLEKAASGRWEPTYCVPRYATKVQKSG
ncbi:hypothetical protein NMY22_g5358 [Coprinellus aureogranulatus]|nr:hypothetical protein NMY22_g5358 [Coprinellus aureogranulatus]